MRKEKKSIYFFLLLGLLLVVVFAVGMICMRNPDAFQNKYIRSFSVTQICDFCVSYCLPAGIIGIPMFLISMIVSLIRESKEKKDQ